VQDSHAASGGVTYLRKTSASMRIPEEETAQGQDSRARARARDIDERD
jgi:hypothetical protein